MAKHKVGRASEDLRRELSDVIRTMKDPRVAGLLSIVSLSLSNDMSHCKVFISSINGMEAAKEAVKILNDAGGFIRSEMAGRMEMRRIPAFQFVADDSIAYSADMAKKISDLLGGKDENND